MYNITLDEIQPGMYLSKPLFSSDGKVLLHEGVEVTERYIQYLRNKGITSLFIGEPGAQPSAGSEEDGYDLPHRQEAVNAARELVEHFRVGKGIHIDRAKSTVSDIIDRFSQQPEYMMQLLDLRRTADYLFSRAVNTCMLAVMTGLTLGYEQQQLDELGLAALLHDIGKTKLPPHLTVQFPKTLSRQEREAFKRHIFYTVEMLKANPNIPDSVVNACFQYHERWNGQGYPMGLKGNTISEYAQIIAIADVYDRLITGLPHRLPTPVYYAVAILNKAAGVYFNPALIEKFNQNIAVYPMGKAVILNTRQKGVILGVSMKNRTIPVVRLTADQEGNPLEQALELNLAKNPDLFIVDFEDAFFSYAQSYADRAYVNHAKTGTLVNLSRILR